MKVASPCSSCKRPCTYAAVVCSLCQDMRHLECLKIPLKFLFVAGSQAGAHEGDFESAQSLGYKLIAAKVEGSGISPLQIVQETLGKCGARYDPFKEMVILDNVCKACIQSREVEQFLDFYDTETKRTIVRLVEYDDEDFSDGLKQRCYYKVKLNGTSHLHTVWLPF